MPLACNSIATFDSVIFSAIFSAGNGNIFFITNFTKFLNKIAKYKNKKY